MPLPLQRGALLLISLAAAAAPLRAVEPARLDFNRDVRPLLSDRCFTCHGFDAKARKGELRLDTPEGASALHDGVPAIVPGKPEQSVLWQRILSTDPEKVMPPADSHLTLSAAEKELLRRWIAEGAVYQPHWAFVRVTRPELPADNTTAQPIDAFVAHRIARENLQPAPEADRRTLIRRLSFDLRGLPPSPEEVESFVADPAPDAYERRVDAFLASPAYGERMAWPWLDAARYADSNGYQGDADRTMWPWRDWVVDAFNRNLPYDRFTVWQLAGDQLPDATDEQKLATGFLRNHPINGEGGRIPEENRVDYAMDMTETTGTVWLGLTMNCCRCHDHKYDPLLQRDYYSLLDFFNQTPVDGSGGDPRTPPVLAVPSAAQKAQQSQLAAALAQQEQRLATRAAALAPGQEAWEAARATAPGDWRPLDLAEVSSPGMTFETLPDHSVLAGGANPATATYTIRTPLSAGRLTGLRLDALRHPSMTLGGIARSDSGNFVLTGFEARLILPGDAGAGPQRLSFARAEATYEQGGVFRAANAIDDDPASGWAIWEGKPVDRDHAIVFPLSSPLEIPAGAELQLVLRHDSPHPQHLLGRFRISTTGVPAPSLGGADETLLAALRVPPAERNETERQRIGEAYRKSDPEYARLSAGQAELQQRRKQLEDTLPKVMVMADRPGERRKTHILAVGAYDKPGAEVIAATPGILPPLHPAGPVANRLDLAQWLVSRDHPLMSRVTVNRLWQEFFGIGLIRTPEDFGVQSEVPVYPEILDWLAADFMESGWDMKRLVRTIVTSRTYRQSSQVSVEHWERDPANRLLTRGPRFRLPAWMIRDQALSAAGLLVPTLGGPPVKPYQPDGLWEEATFGKTLYQPDHGEALHRRSLYTFWRRISAPPGFFDNARREVCTVTISRTNTPLHALSTLNDVTFVEAGRLLAARAIREANPGPNAGAASALARAFTIALGRPPDAAEQAILTDSFEQARLSFAADPAKATAFLANGEAPAETTLPPADHAALAAVCLSLLNTDEALTKQ